MESASEALSLDVPFQRALDARGDCALEEAPDCEVVQAVLAGQKARFELLVTRYERKIFRHVYRMTRNVEDAEDLTQETFAKAYRALTSYREAFPFRSWLFQIATNATISALRKRRPHRSLDEAEDLDQGALLHDRRAKSPRAQAATAEMIRRLKDAVRTLSPLAQAVFNMRYGEEMKIEEIARTLESKPGAVTVVLHRARRRLAELLSADASNARNGGAT